MSAFRSAAACAVLMLAGHASAQVTASMATANGDKLTIGAAGLFDGSTPIAALSGGAVYSDDQARAMAPAPTLYGGTYLAAGPSAGGDATLVFNRSVSEVGFLWGSPDGYNVVTVTTAFGAQSFTAYDLGFPAVDGAVSSGRFVRFQSVDGSPITALSFGNVPSIDAFEIADFTAVTSVPEPLAWSLMLIGLGAAGAVLRRRGKAGSPQIA